MNLDALISVNPYFKFVENLNNPDEYHKFTDHLIKYVECIPKPEFKEAQKILKRIHERDLYRCIGERIFDNFQNQRLQEEVCAQDIINCQDGGGQLRVEDIVVHKFSINFGHGLQNPVELVKFY